MGCVVVIPERVLDWRRIQDGVSLQVQRRKFQSLVGVRSELRDNACISRFMSIPNIGGKFSHGLPTLALMKHAITFSGGVSLQVRRQRFASFDNYLVLMDCPSKRLNSSLKLNTATRKTIVRLNRWLITINLPSSTWIPIRQSAIPLMLIRFLRLKNFQLRLSPNNSNLTFFQKSQNGSSLRT